jgi:excisionase family DNA binding protein
LNEERKGQEAFQFVVIVSVPAKILARLKEEFQMASDGADSLLTPAVSNFSEQEDPWYPHKNAAAYIGISMSTLYKYAHQRKIAHRKLAGHLQFRKSVLDEFMKSYDRPATGSCNENDSVVTRTDLRGVQPPCQVK